MSSSIPESPSTEWFAAGIIDQRKFTEYLLCPTHPDGKNKLRIWRSVFGVGERDGELLERLIREQLHQATPVEREPVTDPDDPGRVFLRWQLDIPRFKGPNNNVGPVLTAWALEPERDRPHLTNAYPIIG